MSILVVVSERDRTIVHDTELSAQPKRTDDLRGLMSADDSFVHACMNILYPLSQVDLQRHPRNLLSWIRVNHGVALY